MLTHKKSASSIETFKKFYSRFPQVPEEEQVIHGNLDFNLFNFIYKKLECHCALNQKGLLFQGKMYITHFRICFYSNILGTIKQVVIPFEDVEDVVKKNLSVIPHGILIRSHVQEFFFSSFLRRDFTFDELSRYWNHTESHFQSIQVYDLPPSPPYSIKVKSKDKSKDKCTKFKEMNHSPIESIYADPFHDFITEKTANTPTGIPLKQMESKRCKCECDNWIPIMNQDFPIRLDMFWNILQGDPNVDMEDVLPAHAFGFMGSFFENVIGASKLSLSPWKIHPDGNSWMQIIPFSLVKDGMTRQLSYETSLSMFFFNFFILKIQKIVSVSSNVTILHHSNSFVCYENHVTSQVLLSAFKLFIRVCLIQESWDTTRMQVFARPDLEEKERHWIVKSSIDHSLRFKIKDHYASLAKTLTKLITQGVLLSNSPGSSFISSTMGSTLVNTSTRGSFFVKNTKNRQVTLLERVKTLSTHIQSHPMWRDSSVLLILSVVLLLVYSIVTTVQIKLQLDYLLSRVN